MNASPATTSVFPSLFRTVAWPLTTKYISHCSEWAWNGKFDLPGGIRFNSTSNGHRFAKSSELGSRPSASAIPVNATAHFPFGDCHGSSLISLTLTFRTEILDRINKIYRIWVQK